MFRGNNPATVDDKGRLKIPASFKSELDAMSVQDFFVTSLDGKSVWVYPLPAWLKIEEKLASLPTLNKAKRHFLDRTNFWGQLARADAQGRVLIPALLREAAGMTGEVAVLGYLNYLEVWNMERYREHLESEPLTAEDEQALTNLGI